MQARREEPVSELAIPAATRAEKLEEFSRMLGGEAFAGLELAGGRGTPARLPDGLACRRPRVGRSDSSAESPRLPLAEQIELVAAGPSELDLRRWLGRLERPVRSLGLNAVGWTCTSPPPWLERLAAGHGGTAQRAKGAIEFGAGGGLMISRSANGPQRISSPPGPPAIR